MAVYKDGDKWRVIYRYTNYKGERKQKQKRGFATKREALGWEREVMLKSESKLDMTFASFFEIYEADKKKRVKENTWESKSHVIRTKILPYFGERKIAEIEPRDVIAWQNEMLAYKGENGEVYSPTYLKTIHAQLSAIFNHAVRFYHLPGNPAQKAGTMGSEEHKEMLFWTKEEYLKFADAMMDKPLSYYAFEMLYWCGVRLGEMLALTPSDFDFGRNIVTINKSYQRLKGRDVITSPKTAKSNRTIKMPHFLCEEMQEYIGMLYEISGDERMFQVTKSYLHHEMDRGAKAADVKRIRIHDLRHSHISLLIEMGFSALAIADRVGHESIDITYRYAHLFPNKQTEMADKLDMERMESVTQTDNGTVIQFHMDKEFEPERRKGGGKIMEKRLDYKGRWRNKTVAFHVSEEEGKLIDCCVSLSGLTKQDYVTRRLQCRDVVVQGKPRVYKALRNQMAEIHEELKRLEKCSGDNDELLYTIQLIAETMNGLKGKN